MRRVLILVLTGIVAIGVAWSYRQRVLVQRARRAAVVLDPKLRELLARVQPLRKAVAAAPKDLSLRAQLAEIYRDIGDFRGAAEQLQAIARLRPDDRDARLSLGNTYLALKRFKEADSAYREVIRRWHQDADGWQGIATALYHQQRYLEAKEAAQKAVKFNPTDPNNHYVLGTSALRYAAQFPNPLIHSADVNLAGIHLLKLLSVWKDHYDVHYHLGRAYMLLRNRKGAVQNLRRAMELSHGQPEVAYYLATAYVASGDRASAGKVVKDALERRPDDPLLNELWGELLQSSKEPDAHRKALEAFRKAVELMPDNPLFREKLGVAYLRVGEMKQAQEAFEMAMRLNPNRSFPYQQLAAIYTRQGQPERASQFADMAQKMVYNEQLLKQIESLTLVHPNDVRLRLILADRYRELGLTGASRDEYLFVLRLDKNNKRAKAGLLSLEQKPSRVVQK